MNKIKEANKNICKKKKIKIYFSSIDEHIKCSFSCYKTDIFKKIGKKLIKKFPILKIKKFYFICNGGTLNHENFEDKTKTLDEIGIKEDTHILINFCE